MPTQGEHNPTDEVSKIFLRESKMRVAQARLSVMHCLDQLTDEDIWWAPREGENSVGILVQHLMGSLRQRIVSEVGREKDIRDRKKEFSSELKRSKEELKTAFNEILDQVVEVYDRQGNASLLEPRYIKEFKSTALGVIYYTMGHLDLHVGQIVMLTKLKAGDKYKYLGPPPNSA